MIGCKEIDGVVYEDLYMTAYLKMNIGRCGFVYVERMSHEHARMVRHSHHIMLECDNPVGYPNDCIYVVVGIVNEFITAGLMTLMKPPNEFYGNDTSSPSRPRTSTRRPCGTWTGTTRRTSA